MIVDIATTRKIRRPEVILNVENIGMFKITNPLLLRNKYVEAGFDCLIQDSSKNKILCMNRPAVE